MRRTRAAIGRENQLIGEAFEDVVERWHAMAGLRGALVHAMHNSPPSKIVGGKIIYEKPGVADFTGVLHGGGYLASEAKSVAPGKRLEKSRIEPLQQAHLDAVNAAGGNSLAFLLVEFRVHNSIQHRRYALPWHQVPWKVLKSAESLDERDISAWYQVPAGVDYLARYHAGSDKRYIVGTKVKNVYPRE